MRLMFCKEHALEAAAATPPWLKDLIAELDMLDESKAQAGCDNANTNENKGPRDGQGGAAAGAQSRGAAKSKRNGTDTKRKTAMHATSAGATAVAACGSQRQATKRWRAGILDKRMIVKKQPCDGQQGAAARQQTRVAAKSNQNKTINGDKLALRALVNPAHRRRPVQAPWPVWKPFNISWNKEYVRSDFRHREWIKLRDEMVHRRANYMRLERLKRFSDPDGFYNNEDSSVDMLDELIPIDGSTLV